MTTMQATNGVGLVSPATWQAERKAAITDWKNFKEAYRSVPRHALWPGHAGLALVVDGPAIAAEDHGQKILANGDGVRFVSLAVYPPSPSERMEQVRMALHPTRVHCGRLTIGGGKPILSCDWRARPPRGDDYTGRLAHIVNGLWEGVIAAGFSRTAWRPFRPSYLAALGLAPNLRPPYCFHGPRASVPASAAPALEACFPVPYLGLRPLGVPRLPQPVEQLYRTRPEAARLFLADYIKGLPLRVNLAGTFAGALPSERGEAWVDLMVARDGGVSDRYPAPASVRYAPLVGQALGVEDELGFSRLPVPSGFLRAHWNHWNLQQQWDAAAVDLGGFEAMALHFNDWLERQEVYPPGSQGLVYLRPELVSGEDLSRSVGKLLWDVAPAQSLFDAETESFRLPPVALDRPDRAVYELPHGVLLSLEAPQGFRVDPTGRPFWVETPQRRALRQRDEAAAQAARAARDVVMVPQETLTV